MSLLGVAWAPRLERERARAFEAEMRDREALVAELRARRAQPGPGENKP